MPVKKDEGTYVDTGTGLYQNPSEPTEHGDGGVHIGVVDTKTNKGMVPLKKDKPHTYTQDADDIGPPTGAASIPEPEPVYQWPHPELRAVQAAENKSVKKAAKK